MLNLARLAIATALGMSCFAGVGQLPALANPALKPDAIAVGVAQQLGFPPVPPNSGIIGPLTDSQGIAYLDQSGRISYFNPQQLSVFFATVDASGTPQLTYALGPTGTYQFQGGQAIQVNPTAIEADVAVWPYSGEMVNILILGLQQYQAQIAASGVVPGNLPVEQQSYVNSVLHNTSMNILNNIGSDGCTEHYEGVYYLGCW
ncbi:MAG: hypothetical protein AAGF24_10460 [Cyanobacteria bacterium P01_H01_bin.121]